MAIKIGITGGIGSGKSVVSRLLATMGIPVYIADIEAKKLTNTDHYIRQKLISLLGEDVYLNNQLNKTLLANYLFSNPANAQTINNIIHPRVKEDFREWAVKHSSEPVIAMESAILIESGFADEVDSILMVYAPEEIRIERAMKRDNATRESINQRISNQMNDEEKKNMADFIIINDSNTPLIPQVAAVLNKLQSMQRDS